MPAPLVQHVFSRNTPAANYHRSIDTAYHVECTARSAEEIRDVLMAQTAIQARAAEVALRAQGAQVGATLELAGQQAETNALLGATMGGLRELQAVAEGTLDAVYELTATVAQGFEQLSRQMAEQQKTLQEIAGVLRRRYQTEALELRDDANKWLVEGMRTEGRDRRENWDDALRQLRNVTENPIGMQDYVTWFQIGWLQWKHLEDISAAEESFYRAARLSAPSRDAYHHRALCHLAHMQYLQGKHAEAHETSQRALAVSRDHDTCFEAARYAAKTDNVAEATALLEECIRQRPITFRLMWGEEDLQ